MSQINHNDDLILQRVSSQCSHISLLFLVATTYDCQIRQSEIYTRIHLRIILFCAVILET